VGSIKQRVAVLDLLSGQAPVHRTRWLYHLLYRRQFYGIMPQAVAAWCRRRGHVVHYATYFGQQAPETLVPNDLDVIFICAFTEASALAYALAKFFRARGVRTVLGGPHARSFPLDASRFFDVVVSECDESLIRDILSGDHPTGIILRSQPKQLDIPCLAERYDDLKKAAFIFGRYSNLSVVSLLASTGCPYSCDFCIDWDNPYIRRKPDELAADLKFANQTLPGRFLAFYDPNFGVNFDSTMKVIEEASHGRRNPYIIESSLSILKEGRLGRLRDTGCMFIAPGVESWNDFGQKAGTGLANASEKFHRITTHFEMISRYVPSLQANFMFGNDADDGRVPVDLTISFISRFPNVFPGLAFPIAFGGTPLRQKLRDSNRLFPLPPMFYVNPLPTFRIKNYSMSEFFSYLILIFRSAIAPQLQLSRLAAALPAAVRLAFFVRSLEIRAYVSELQAFLAQLSTDRELQLFNDGASNTIPAYYFRLLERRLGRYSNILSSSETRVVAAD
jgi:hypothetical protein